MHLVGSTGNTANSTRPRKERRMTYVLRDSNDSKHCSGINSVTVPNGFKGDNEGEYLFSASRDGTLKRWELGGDEAVCGATFESHVDWTWKPFSDGECTRTFREHPDYVTSLAAARHNNTVASGGLSREVFIWDLEAAVVPVARAQNDANEDGNFEHDRAIASNNHVAAASVQKSSLGYAPLPAKGHKESVYALSMNGMGTILVSGGTEKVVRVWDPRTGSKQMKLKGHTDNVRALLLDPTGRLWDLGQQRCIHSYAVHIDSVWALASTPSFSHVYSGRDFSVYLTDLSTRESILLCKEEHPVLGLALQVDEWLWAATTDSSLHKWPARERSATKTLQRTSSFVAGLLPFARARANIDGSAPHAILNDRRHVLTKDAACIVKRWEITRGAVVEDYGKVDFEEKEKKLFEMVSVPAWFTMDTRLGSMSVHLDTPQCFSAEMYAVDLHVPGASEELKLNIGQETLRGLLAHWLTQRRTKAVARATPNGDVSPSLSSGAGEHASSRLTALDDSQHEPNNQQTRVLRSFEFSTQFPPSIIFECSQGVPWRKKATELDETVDEKDLPGWCVDCVLHGRSSQRENAKFCHLI
uniref:Uncharacterized protein n=1 Tax=Physcomitrium patens TaxID=3218 RepID=A0A7I4BYF2_PHYPA